MPSQTSKWLCVVLFLSFLALAASPHVHAVEDADALIDCPFCKLTDSGKAPVAATSFAAAPSLDRFDAIEAPADAAPPQRNQHPARAPPPQVST